MHAHSLIVGALVVTSAAAAEPVIFHTSQFRDASVVELSMLSNRGSSDAAYDFDVTIGLAQVKSDGEAGYHDRGTHRARVRCAPPESVFVGGTDYPVGPSLSSDGIEWMQDLWRTVCTMPTS